MAQVSYAQYVQEIHNLYVKAGGTAAPLSPLERDSKIPAHPTVLIFAPHPDDECLMGGYALRMQEEWGAKVFVLPFSYGSDVKRQQARKTELEDALSVLGFSLQDPHKNGLSKKISVDELTAALSALKPDIVFSPHEFDGHPTHEECYRVMAKSLRAQKSSKPQLWVQTEFWGHLKTPNKLVPLSLVQATHIGEALLRHTGEVKRNPYHLRLPAWYMDQVRRGSEMNTGAAGVACVFGQLYFESWL